MGNLRSCMIDRTYIDKFIAAGIVIVAFLLVSTVGKWTAEERAKPDKALRISYRIEKGLSKIISVVRKKHKNIQPK